MKITIDFLIDLLKYERITEIYNVSSVINIIIMNLTLDNFYGIPISQLLLFIKSVRNYYMLNIHNLIPNFYLPIDLTNIIKEYIEFDIKNDNEINDNEINNNIPHTITYLTLLNDKNIIKPIKFLFNLLRQNNIIPNDVIIYVEKQNENNVLLNMKKKECICSNYVKLNKYICCKCKNKYKYEPYYSQIYDVPFVTLIISKKHISKKHIPSKYIPNKYISNIRNYYVEEYDINKLSIQKWYYIKRKIKYEVKIKGIIVKPTIPILDKIIFLLENHIDSNANIFDLKGKMKCIKLLEQKNNNYN